MSTYNPAPKSAIALLEEVMRSYDEHKQLIDEKVTIDFLMAFPKEKADGTEGDAIKCHGGKALGLVKRTGIKEHVLGHADVLLLVDGPWWNNASDLERRALLDHEMYHIDLKRDDTMAVERNDASRPKVIFRKHDYQFGHFRLIAKRHGTASQEVQQMAQIMEESGQFFFPALYEPTSKMLFAAEAEDDARKFQSKVLELGSASAR